SPPRHVPRSSKASTSMQTKGLRPPSSLLCALRASAANLPLPTRPRGRTASHALLVLGVARCLESGAKSGRVALLVLLSRPPDGEGLGRDVARHGRAGGHVRVTSDGHGGHDLRVAPEEHACFDRGRVLAGPV